MKRLLGLTALAMMFSFGTVAVTAYAGDAPAPTEGKEKKKPTAPKAGEEEKKKGEKKGGGGH